MKKDHLRFYHVELDCGLIKIDVMGKSEIWHLSDCAQLRIGFNDIVELDNFSLLDK